MIVSTFMMRTLSLVTAMACVSVAYSADLESQRANTPGGMPPYVSLTGPIRVGDAVRFAAILERNPTINRIYIDSPGGDVKEAIKIGEIVRAARIDTYVQAGKTCASSCFFVWLNGANRAVITWPVRNRSMGEFTPAARLGLHRPYLTDFSTSNAVANQAKGMELVRNYLISKFIPSRLIDAMMARSSQEIYWLDSADLAELGEAPPDLQELYIAKCGDNRRELYEKMTVARKMGDERLRDILLGDVSNINDCIDSLSAKSRASALIGGFRDILGSE